MTPTPNDALLKKVIITAGIIGSIGAVIYYARQASTLKPKVQVRKQQQPSPSAPVDQPKRPRHKMLRPGMAVDADIPITNPPITIRYVETSGQFNDRGYLSFGTTFWVTNHTSSILEMNLRTIEAKTGSNWIIHSAPDIPFLFRPAGKPSEQQFHLDPYAAGNSTVELSGQPTNGIWRARVSVAKQLTGMAGSAEHLRRYPEFLKRRFDGDTNIPVNLFATNINFYEQVGDILSQEVREE